MPSSSPPVDTQLHTRHCCREAGTTSPMASDLSRKRIDSFTCADINFSLVQYKDSCTTSTTESCTSICKRLARSHRLELLTSACSQFLLALLISAGASLQDFWQFGAGNLWIFSIFALPFYYVVIFFVTQLKNSVFVSNVYKENNVCLFFFSWLWRWDINIRWYKQAISGLKINFFTW